MSKINLYVYPNAKRHVHDDHKFYYNTVPFSEKGIKDHCNLVGPYTADYFYMGQISDSDKIDIEDFQFFEDYPQNHIVDIEGDWATRMHPQWLSKCLYTINGAPRDMLGRNLCVRPTFSSLLLDIIKNRKPFLEVPTIKRSYGFRGYPDPWGVRNKVLNATKYFMNQIPSEYILNKEWTSSSIDPTADIVKEYEQLMLRHSFALCPRGMGHDSVRFYEACYFGRIPVIVGDNLIVNEDRLGGVAKTMHYFQISQYSSMESIHNKLNEILTIKDENIMYLSALARNYFENVIREYFADPTKYCIDRLKMA